jgi:hypothetical protein
MMMSYRCCWVKGKSSACFQQQLDERLSIRGGEKTFPAFSLPWPGPGLVAASVGKYLSRLLTKVVTLFFSKTYALAAQCSGRKRKDAASKHILYGHVDVSLLGSVIGYDTQLNEHVIKSSNFATFPLTIGKKTTPCQQSRKKRKSSTIQWLDFRFHPLRKYEQSR